MEEIKNREMIEETQDKAGETPEGTEGMEETPEGVEGTEGEILAEEAAPLTEEKEETTPDPKELELAEARDKILRLHADFDNFRKRMQREKEEWFQYASMNIIEKLLPVVDNLERAIESLNRENEEVQNLFSGVVMTYRQLSEVLQREGLQPIAAVGQIFDPMIHEAIMQVSPEEGQEDNLVVEELRKGYRYKDRVIRPAMVKVAKK